MQGLENMIKIWFNSGYIVPTSKGFRRKSFGGVR